MGSATTSRIRWSSPVSLPSASDLQKAVTANDELTFNDSALHLDPTAEEVFDAVAAYCQRINDSEPRSTGDHARGGARRVGPF